MTIWRQTKLVLSCVVAFVFICQPLTACPFCTTIRPTLVQQREAADRVAVAEAEAAGDASQPLQSFRIHRWLQDIPGGSQEERIAIACPQPLPQPGTLGVLFGTVGDGSIDAATLTPHQSGERVDDSTTGARVAVDWHWQSADEAALAYLVAAPASTRPAGERLAYFARHLEHANGLIAEDAYNEFAHADYDEVVQAAAALPMQRLRDWLVDPQIPEARKGFYGMALGLASDDTHRQANRALLRQCIMRQADDFRAGFDGQLAGYLLLTGTEGLGEIESRFLVDPHAAAGDLRHVASALRFYYEFGPVAHRPQVASALARLLDRPDVAAAAIVDLARWQHWGVADKVADLWGRADYDDAATRRAIVGYLAACPGPAGFALLSDLRRRDPRRVEAAEAALLLAPAGQ